MKTRKITLREYCHLHGYSYESRWIQKKLRSGEKLPGVVSVEKFGSSYMIEIIEL